MKLDDIHTSELVRELTSRTDICTCTTLMPDEVFNKEISGPCVILQIID